MSLSHGNNGSNTAGKLLAVIGDEDTCVGFLLGGIGNVDNNRLANFLAVDEKTTVKEIEDAFKRFLKQDDISMILITQSVANTVRGLIDAHLQPQPAVLEIPSRTHPYDASRDSILRRAVGIFNPEEQ